MRCLRKSDFTNGRAHTFMLDAVEQVKSDGWESLTDYLYCSYVEEKRTLQEISDYFMYSPDSIRRCLAIIGIEIRGYKKNITIDAVKDFVREKQKDERITNKEAFDKIYRKHNIKCTCQNFMRYVRRFKDTHDDVVFKLGKKRLFLGEDQKKIKEMKDAGVGILEIARRFNCSPTAIRTALFR